MTDLPLTILGSHSGWVAIDKPAGALVIPGRLPGDGGPTLRERLESQLGEKLFVVHRLDRDTSGVLLFARTAEAHRQLSMAFEQGEVEKHYTALVQGRWTEPTEMDLALSPGRRGGTRPARAGEAGKAAMTRFRPLEVFAEATWIEASPVTGRTHQIRVHARAAGHPLLVDPRYGDPGPWTRGEVTLSRTPLHACSLRLPGGGGSGAHPTQLSAPTPPDLMAVLAQLRT